MRDDGDLFRAPPQPQHSPLVLVLLSYLFSLSTLMRLVDAVVLLWRPRLLRAYLRTWGTSFTKTPWADGSFDKVSDAHRGGKSVIELTYGETPTSSAIRLLRRAGVGRDAACCSRRATSARRRAASSCCRPTSTSSRPSCAPSGLR
jgi:hypothetical protein